MTRIAGDAPTYAFRLCRLTGKGKGAIARPTQHGFDLVSVSTFLGDVMGKPAGAMSYWGFRIGMDGIVQALLDGESLDDLDADALEQLLKERGVSPNMRRDEAGDRGNNAHQILEWLANQARVDYEATLVEPKDPPVATFRMVAEAYADDEFLSAGTEYGFAVLDWWDTVIQPCIEDGSILEVRAEVPVWSLKLGYAGQFDLAILWLELDELGLASRKGWEIVDLKTHKPAQGFTKEGKGAGYVSEAAQIRAYRMAWEEMGLGKTIGQRTLVARDKTYRGSCWLEDFREVSEDFVRHIRAAYEDKHQFEKGEV